MAEMTPGEPQSAANYDDRTTAAVKKVLVEIGQILGSFKGKFAIVGGAVPWLLLGNEDMPHVGTLDVDVSLDAEALGDGEYATLIDALRGHGYGQRDALRRLQLVRQVPVEDGGAPIDVIVDFLMPRDAEIVKNDPPLISDFAVQRADGADLALRYDIYYCIRNYPDGPEALAEACRPLLEHASGAAGYGFIAGKFDTVDGFGPTCVRRFVEDTDVLGDRSPEQWQQDAFGQVDAWLEALGLRN
jgi:hypothetical protein